MSNYDQAPEEPQPTDDHEISDEQLEQATGGFGPIAANEGGAFAGPFGSSW